MTTDPDPTYPSADLSTISDDQMTIILETTETHKPSHDPVTTDTEPTYLLLKVPVNCNKPLTICFKNETEFPTTQIPKNTTTVEVKNSNISTLKKDAINRFSSLEILVLCNNNISVIVPGVFRSQKKLKYLDLGDNALTEISGKIWFGLTYLETLRISGNRLQSLPPNAFSNLPELKVLAVGYPLLVQEKQKLFAPNTFPNSKKQPQIGLEEDDNFLVCNSSNCWLKEKEEKGLLVHYEKNGRPSRPKCSDKPGLYWDEVDLKCPDKVLTSGWRKVHLNNFCKLGQVNKIAKWNYIPES